MFHEESYDRHGEWYNTQFPTRDTKVDFYHKKQRTGNGTIAYWLQEIFFSCLDPLLNEKNQNWLTVGDAYGFDAQYILSKGSNALATDLNSDFLEVALKEGIIETYAAENAEKLSFSENQFDYVLCKESYHHFPRPYSALYEMIRVARKGIIVIEPQDPVSKMPLLLFLTNLTASKHKLQAKIWKNRFSFEQVGNFVYKVSEREFEKFTAGLNLPMAAFKHINPNFYTRNTEQMQASNKSKKFLLIKLKKGFLDLLVKCNIIPGQVLVTIVFKELPDQETLKLLKQNGYTTTNIPNNPYVG